MGVSGRDANQLAADVRQAVMLSMSLTQPPPARWTHDDYDRAMVALDELVTLVGTLQQERDEAKEQARSVQRIADVRFSRAKTAEAALATAEAAMLVDIRARQAAEHDLEMERSLNASYKAANEQHQAALAEMTENRDTWMKLAKGYEPELVSAERALATTRQALAEIERGRNEIDQWLGEHELRGIARRALADAGGDTAAAPAPFPNPYPPNSESWHTFERHWWRQAHLTREAAAGGDT